MARNDGDQRVLATAQHIVKALGKNEQFTEDMIRILSNFDDRFSNMNDFIREDPGSSASSITTAFKRMEERLQFSEGIIMRWEKQNTLIWDSDPQDANAYIKAVDELSTLMQSSWTEKSFLDRVHVAINIAVSRLKDEFKFLVIMNSETVDADWLLACKNGLVKDQQSGTASDSSEDELENEDIPVAHPVSEFNASFDPIPSDRVKDLNAILKRMAKLGAVRDCSLVYANVRKDVLEQSLYRLGLEKPNPEFIQKVNWDLLEPRIRKWIQALKVAVKVTYAAEKRLCDKVFADFNTEGQAVFIDIASSSFMQFLVFAKAVAMTRRTPEKLFRILDMYELIRELQRDIHSIFHSDIVRSEISTVAHQIADAAHGILQEFETAIQKDAMKTPVRGGGFHPLTRYVMNYIKFLVDYSASLELLLKGRRREVPRSLGVETFGLLEGLMDDRSSKSEHASPFAVQVMWLIVHLESNLDGKAKLYSDPAMSFLFLMNNVNYIVEKVKQSELATLLGDGWIRKHAGQVRAYARSYIQTAWAKVFSCLRDEGIVSNAKMASGIPTFAVKDRLKSFNIAFEEVCTTQKAAVVPDLHLREGLRMAIAEKLIPDYRAFIARYGNYLQTGRQPGKYLKYYPDDLENCVIDLFDGPP